MTEHEAWVYLAHQWNTCPTPKSTLFKYSISLPKYQSAESICYAIICLHTSNHISAEVYQNMKQTMLKHVPQSVDDGISGSPLGYYWWPVNAIGVRARAKFCQRMADLTKE
jgi:hypothetical protein